jgi:parallel beta-helix repeat protein
LVPDGARVRKVLVLALVLAALGPRAAEARRRLVPRQHRTIQAAIDAAQPGDTVAVAPGVYRGTIELKKPLVLISEAGPGKTFLDGGDSVRVVHVEGVRRGSIIGFGIRHGKANGGGGIQLVRDTTFAVGGCVLTKNWESAISVWGSNEISISGCKVSDNQGSGVRVSDTIAAIFNCEFTSNEGHEGGGLFLSNTRLMIPLRNDLFVGNRAKGGTGGGLCVADSSEGTIVNCTFRENTTDVAGGGLAAMTAATVNVSRSFFTRNHAPTGPAISADYARTNVGYSVFDQNTADGVAGAIGMRGRGMANVNPILSNNTFYKNRVKGDGANLFFIDVSPEVRKNIFVLEHDQGAVTGLQTSPRYDCNLIWDPSGGAIGALPSANTWVGDPLFCDAEHGDFKLRDLSPALRAPCGPIGALSESAGCSTFRLQPAN